MLEIAEVSLLMPTMSRHCDPSDAKPNWEPGTEPNVPAVKLTELFIAKPASPQVTYQVIYWDALLPAIGLRIGQRAKTFVVIRGRERKRQSIGQFPALSLAEARAQARALMQLDDEGVCGSSGQMDVAKAVRQHLANLAVRWRTHQVHERLLGRHMLPVLGHRKFSDITACDILAITDRLNGTPVERRHCHVACRLFSTTACAALTSLSPQWCSSGTPSSPTAAAEFSYRRA
jgi:hypothetical protein